MVMLRHRPLELPNDARIVVKLHALGNYINDPPWATTEGFQAYLEEWLATTQPNTFLASVGGSINDDDRTIAEIWEHDGKVVGFLWATFSVIEGYQIGVGEERDILVRPEFHRRGLGSRMLRYAERAARDHGAALLRADIGVRNIPSRELHDKMGFRQYWSGYEKVLVERPKG